MMIGSVERRNIYSSVEEKSQAENGVCVSLVFWELFMWFVAVGVFVLRSTPFLEVSQYGSFVIFI